MQTNVFHAGKRKVFLGLCRYVVIVNAWILIVFFFKDLFKAYVNLRAEVNSGRLRSADASAFQSALHRPTDSVSRFPFRRPFFFLLFWFIFKSGAYHHFSYRGYKYRGPEKSHFCLAQQSALLSGKQRTRRVRNAFLISR